MNVIRITSLILYEIHISYNVLNYLKSVILYFVNNPVIFTYKYVCYLQ